MRLLGIFLGVAITVFLLVPIAVRPSVYSAHDIVASLIVAAFFAYLSFDMWRDWRRFRRHF